MLGPILAAAASIGSSILGNKASEKAADKNANLQREFAQSGIQWKVEDAKKAGISPIYALGAQTHSFSPVQVGSDFSGVAQAGQDIGRAIDSTRSPGAKLDAYTQTAQQLQLTRMGLENELLGSQIAKLRQGSPSPGIPTGGEKYLIDGQTQTLSSTPALEEQFKRSPSRTGEASLELGTVADAGHTRTPMGGYAVVPSMDAKNRIEDQAIPEISWAIRNMLAPMFSEKYMNPPKLKLAPGYKWTYNPITAEYYPVRRNKRFPQRRH